MYCRSCPHRLAVSKGVFVDHLCAFSGAQVAEFAMSTGSTEGQTPTADGVDDPDCLCPATLHRRVPRGIVIGVLMGAEQRGQLAALLDCYPSGERAWLEGLLLEMHGAMVDRALKAARQRQRVAG